MRTSRWGLARWGLARWGWYQGTPLVIECVPADLVEAVAAHADLRDLVFVPADHRTADLTAAPLTQAELSPLDSINVTVEVQ